MSGKDDKGDKTFKPNRREAIATSSAAFVTSRGSARSIYPIAAAGIEKMVAIEALTNVAVAASPDGRTLAIDLFGILWTLPVTGGSATRLTGDFDDLAQPDWSPDGKRMVFQSYRTGNFHIWSIAAEGGSLKQHSDGLCDDREPRWSPDGKTIAFSSDRSEARYAIHLLEVSSGKISLFSKGSSQDSEPCWSPDGRTIAYVADGVRLMNKEIGSGTTYEAASVPVSKDRLMRPSEIRSPAFAPDGTLHYFRVAADQVTLVAGQTDIILGEDIYSFRPAFLPEGGFIYGSGGRLKKRGKNGVTAALPFSAQVPVTQPQYAKKRRDFESSASKPVCGIVAPALSPDGQSIVFAALNDLWLMPIGRKPRYLVHDGFYKCDPAWSPDGKMIAYSTDRGGTLDIWLKDVATGHERQLTNLPDLGLVSPSWSQDGRLITCLDQQGILYTIDVVHGTLRQIYEALWEPGRPSFGPDATTICCAAFKPIAARFREGLSEILTVDVATGLGSYRPVQPGKSIGVRGLDGPVWSPDGSRLAYVMASTLWVVPVDRAGRFTGEPRQITTEVTDAPSWSGDSASLLYLSNGRLRRVSADGGKPVTIPCSLRWANAKPVGRILLQPDGLWDGLAPVTKAGKEILVEGQKIAAILDAGTVTDTDARRIKAPGQTLMPGLIDMHTHRQMQGYNYGDRMGRIWLALGITATRSPGCPAYHMVEDREAIQGGHRIAPRHFATGEAIDGGRIYYNFMRPVTEDGQLDLELSRARALDYDMVKTYVRLPHDVQKQVVARAHAMGMHLTSHYHYPALHSGMDAMEHLGATSRFGYSRTITSLGGGYQDVNGLFAAAKAVRTPTLLIAAVLLGEDDRLAHDTRIKTLFPPWEYARLMTLVSTMRQSDPAPLLRALQRQVDQIKQTMSLGGRIISGTDAPIDLVAISLHLNLRAMVRCGITPLEALYTATRNSGEFLDEPIGRILPGMLADLILVEGNPLGDIDAVSDVRTVLANGVVHTPAELAVPFAASQLSAFPRNRALARSFPDQHHFWEGTAYVEAGRHACCDGHKHFAFTSMHEHHHPESTEMKARA